MTSQELLMLPKGTKVKIKDSINCHLKYKIGGLLIFGNTQQESIDGGYDYDSDGYEFGISTEIGTCFEFEADDYELLH